MGSLTLRCTGCQRRLPDEAFCKDKSRYWRRQRHIYCYECRAAQRQQPGECVHCSAATPSRKARLCNDCRPVHWSGVNYDLYLDRYGHTGLWTRERIIKAIQEWTRKYGGPPKISEWNEMSDPGRKFGDRSKRRWPHRGTVASVFGSWRAAIEAAGIQPRRPGDGPGYRNGKTCRNGLHPWVPENIRARSDGYGRCRLCANARAREYQERKRHARR